MERVNFQRRVMSFLRDNNWHVSEMHHPPYPLKALKAGKEVIIFCLPTEFPLTTIRMQEIISCRLNAAEGQPFLCVAAGQLSASFRLESFATGLPAFHYTDLESFAKIRSSDPISVKEFFNEEVLKLQKSVLDYEVRRSQMAGIKLLAPHQGHGSYNPP